MLKPPRDIAAHVGFSKHRLAARWAFRPSEQKPQPADVAGEKVSAALDLCELAMVSCGAKDPLS